MVGVESFPVRVDAVLARLAAQHPELESHLPYLACAVGDEIVPRDHALEAGDTLVLLPPVSGG